MDAEKILGIAVAVGIIALVLYMMYQQRQEYMTMMNMFYQQYRDKHIQIVRDKEGRIIEMVERGI